jgi:hypothetical protein
MSKRIDVAAEGHAFPAAFLQSHLTVDGKTATAYNARGGPHDGAQNATWAPSGPPSAGGSCAGASAGCAGRLHTGRAADAVPCYGWRLERGRPSLAAAAGRRWTEWHDGDDNYRAALATALLVYSHGRQRAHNVDAPAFRINASGDINTATAAAWGTALRSPAVADLEPALDVWIYSRSYGRGHGDGDALRLMLDRHGRPPPRTTVYLSSDATMQRRTRAALAAGSIYRRLPVSMLAADVDDGRRLLALVRGNGPAPRVIACPVDVGRMPLAVTRRGRTVGACAACRYCLPANGAAGDVIFVQR